MIKKLSFVFIFALILTLSACMDQKIQDDSISVIFYAFRNQENIIIYRNVAYDSLIDQPEDPIREGSSFLNWSISPRENIPFDFENDRVTESITLYAFFTAGRYVIEYELNGGTFSNPNAVVYEVAANQTLFLPIVTRVGYEFSGWFLIPIDQVVTGQQPVQSLTNILSNTTVYARWTARRVLVTLRSNMEGVSNPPVRQVTYGSVIDLPVLSDTETHTFIGWEDSQGNLYINGEIFLRANNVTLRGRWEEKSS